MIARINDQFSQAGINVAAQFLRTNEHVGYVVMDVDPGYHRGIRQHIPRGHR